MLPRLLVHAVTSPGSRPVADDRVLARAPLGLFAIADGFGGTADGALAAERALERLERTYAPRFAETVTSDAGALDARLRDAVIEANRQVHALGRARATLAACLFSRSHVAIACVGDCRVARVRAGRVTILAEDESLGALLAKHGARDALPDHLAHHVTRSLGASPCAFVATIRRARIEARDRFVLCSDGACECVDPGDFARALRLPPFAVAPTLIGLARRAGSRDDVSVIVVDVSATEDWESAGTPVAGRSR